MALLPVLTVWLAITGYVIARLPIMPILTNDSASYTNLSAHRPPAYGWLLHVFQVLGGADLAGLPLLQTLLIAFGLLAFALQVAKLLGTLPAAVVVVLVWGHMGTFEATRYAMSEGLFLPALLSGLAYAIAFARHGSLSSLVGTSICFGVAVLTRTAGIVLFLVPVLLVLLDSRLDLAAMARRLLLTAGVAAALLLAGMAGNRAVHDHFEIGSFSGVSLLGKALLVLRPAPDLDPVLVTVAPFAVQARDAVAAAPGFAGSLRAQAQAYEELRWQVFFPAAQAAWPDIATDGRQANLLGRRIAPALIAADPLGYLKLAGRDWASLVLYPHLWPVAWNAADSPHPFFAHCPAEIMRCWAFFRLDIPRYYGVAMLVTSLGGLVATVVLVLGFARWTLRRSLAPAERVMVAMALVVQASLVATALFEAGLWRYTIAVHAMNAALTVWLATLVVRAVSRRKPVAPGDGAAATASDGRLT